jgi:prolyl-tRNA synthetase
MKKGTITKREVDYSEWYLDIVREAELAENSPVRGCMVIKPYGYAIWENIRDILDKKIKDTGHQNAYFPLFIPKSFFAKEAEHIEGFAKECAVVTHYRLKNSDKGLIVDEDAKLTDELIVRPTSETIIYSTYKNWINSHRDLPLLINQWANVVRWELRTRPFLRTTEFLWQEGHTAHATPEEAETEAIKMLNVYKSLAEEYLAIPVILGQKSESEKFAGALRTYTLEAMMQDGKALQSGTSHNLGDHFAKAFDVQFTDTDGVLKYVWQTSWGLSTRIIGALIMVHGDDKGLVIPPRVASVQVEIIPFFKTDDERTLVVSEITMLEGKLKKNNIRVKVDLRDNMTPGAKIFEWEKKGVPLRIEIGPRDIASDSVLISRRDTGTKNSYNSQEVVGEIKKILRSMQKDMFKKALEFQKNKTVSVDSWEEFKEKVGSGNFVMAHWCGSMDCETKIKEPTSATIRCIPFDQKKEDGKCVFCEEKSTGRVLFAKSY